MKALRLGAPGGLDRLSLVDAADPGAPGRGEIRVRIRASSLNYHDLGVVSGRTPTADGRIPMSDGAGEVEAVGEGVTEFAPGDLVVSCFLSLLARRRADLRRFLPDAGRRDGRLCARSRRCAGDPFHPCAERLQRRRGGDDHHRRPHRLARACRQRRAEGRRRRADARHGRRVDFRVADRKGDGRDRDRHLLVRREARPRPRARRRLRRQLSPKSGLGQGGARLHAAAAASIT